MILCHSYQKKTQTVKIRSLFSSSDRYTAPHMNPKVTRKTRKGPKREQLLLTGDQIKIEAYVVYQL